MAIIATRLRCVLLLPLLLGPLAATATDVQPRLLSNIPVGTNVLALDYLHSSGAVTFDASFPAENVDGEVLAGTLSYVRGLNFAGRSGTLAIAAPFVDLTLEGLYLDQPTVAARRGFGDPHVRLAVNLLGAPALTRAEFAAWQQKTILGLSLDVTVPAGKYESERVVNIGTNRWTANGQLGVSHRLGNVTLEAGAGVFYFTDNNEVLGTGRLEQAPLWYTRAAVVWNMPRGWWLSGGCYYGWGGASTLNGVRRDDRRNNTRLGASLSIPLAPGHRINLRVSEGVTARIGDDFFTYGIGYQHIF